MLRKIASAIAAAHANRIIHRDVKPANVLIEKGTDTPFLSDFGLAGIQETGRSAATRLTLAGEILGDPRYISPEQIKGELVTPACDVYSFGIVAIEVLTGRYAYDETDEDDAALLHVRAAPLDLAEAKPDLDRKVASLVQRCLDRAPDRRPTAEQLVRLLTDGGAG